MAAGKGRIHVEGQGAFGGDSVLLGGMLAGLTTLEYPGGKVSPKCMLGGNVGGLTTEYPENVAPSACWEGMLAGF